MLNDYDWDVYDVFREQIDYQLPIIEANILLLDKEDYVVKGVDELFRIFHTYKATSAYLSLKHFNNLVSKVETILGSLREEQRVVPEFIIEWLFAVEDQLFIWLKEMQQHETELSESPKSLNNKICISKQYIPLKEILNTLTILYIDYSLKRAQTVSVFLQKICKNVKFESDINNSKKLIENFKYDILISNAGRYNYDLVSFTTIKNKNKPIVVIFDDKFVIEQKRLLLNGVNNILVNPLNTKSLQKELKLVTKTYFSSANLIIDNKKISKFIQTLKPLPNTIFEVIKVCDDIELSIKDLIRVVKKDPIISANILKAASSPFYGSMELKTIDQAISRLGKTTVKALTMSNLYKNLGELDLTPYDMNEDKFSKVSMTRLSLMIKWYSKVSISDLSILSTTALLGNIGQLLIAKEIIELDDVEYFKELSKAFDFKYAEEKLLHTSTAIISSQILKFWKLSNYIVNIIAFSDNPNEASDELKSMIIANNIVYTLVDINGNICDEIPKEVLNLMTENSLDVEPLQNALNHIINL